MLYIAGGDGATMPAVLDPRKNQPLLSPAPLREARLLEPWQAAVKGRESAPLPEAEPGYYTTRLLATRGGSDYSTLPITITSTAVSPILA